MPDSAYCNTAAPQNHFEPSAALKANASSSIERRCSDAEVLQHMLEVESSRQRLERHARDLSRLAECSANITREAQLVAQKRGDLVATLSHEMRTPLNGILGMVNALRDRNLGPDEQDCVEVIRQASEGLLSLVDETLDLARIEAGKLELQHLAYDVRRMAEDAIRIVRSTAELKGLTLTTEVAAGIPTLLKGDPIRLRQILLNFLSNAVKFTGAGTITLRILEGGTDSDRPSISFCVTDNGIGISPAGQERLFQPFSQADGSIAQRFGGTGLGLAICKRLVELMGGTIGVSSEPEVGSSFWFTVPLHPAELSSVKPVQAVAAIPPPVQNVASSQDARILLVEDNLINQKVALLMLKKLGYTATVAHNGLKALEAVSNSKFDLIFMDCLMPEMDGFQATRAIRAGETEQKKLPIVAITANAFVQDREACLAAGMSDYLPKPVRETELRAMLEKWLPETAAL